MISIVASLMKNCRGPQRQRLLSKFTENDHEKVERLMEMHFKFLEKVTETEQEIARAGKTCVDAAQFSIEIHFTLKITNSATKLNVVYINFIVGDYFQGSIFTLC